MASFKLINEELQIISDLFQHFKEHNSWLGQRTVNQKYGRDVVSKLLSYKPSLIRVEINSTDGISYYVLTFEGIASCPLAKENLDALIQYFHLLISKFKGNPEIQEITSSQIEQALTFTKEQSRILRDLINFGQFWGRSASFGDDWRVGVPSDIEDLVELGPESYLAMHRSKYFESEKKASNVASVPKAFISYSTKDKVSASKIRECLEIYGIKTFLAHDDIEVSEEWKDRIVSELTSANVFVPLLSQNFKESEWAPQEVGMAHLRGMLVIPLCLDKTIPFGFISHYQGKPTTENLSVFLIKPILAKFSNEMIPVLISKMESVGDFRSAEALVVLLAPHFKDFSQMTINDFARHAVANSQVWAANECRKTYLPNFIETHKDRINPDMLRVLTYQVSKGDWYREEASDNRQREKNEPWIKYEQPWLPSRQDWLGKQR